MKTLITGIKPLIDDALAAIKSFFVGDGTDLRCSDPFGYERPFPCRNEALQRVPVRNDSMRRIARRR